MLKKLKCTLYKDSGFSIVELVVVIALMVILTAMMLPVLASHIEGSIEATNAAKASAIYDAALVASTRSILATRDFNKRAQYLAAPSNVPASIAAHLDGDIANSPNDSATLWFDKTFTKVISGFLQSF